MGIIKQLPGSEEKCMAGFDARKRMLRDDMGRVRKYEDEDVFFGINDAVEGRPGMRCLVDRCHLDQGVIGEGDCMLAKKACVILFPEPVPLLNPQEQIPEKPGATADNEEIREKISNLMTGIGRPDEGVNAADNDGPYERGAPRPFYLRIVPAIVGEEGAHVGRFHRVRDVH